MEKRKWLFIKERVIDKIKQPFMKENGHLERKRPFRKETAPLSRVCSKGGVLSLMSSQWPHRLAFVARVGPFRHNNKNSTVSCL
jgi:hypothetical protein